MSSQINLRLPQSLQKSADKYVKKHHYKNIQELTMQALREKIDDEFTTRELRLIEQISQLSLKQDEFVDGKTLFSNSRKEK